MFHPVYPRLFSVGDSPSFSFSWGEELTDLLDEDDDAPWDNAALLFKWGPEGGEPDDSYEKGENSKPNGHHKRSNVTDLATRDLDNRDLDYGLALYCVDCGFSGTATIWGSLYVEVDILPPSISLTTLQAGFDATFQAGLNLGLEALIWSLRSVPV